MQRATPFLSFQFHFLCFPYFVSTKLKYMFILDAENEAFGFRTDLVRIFETIKEIITKEKKYVS